LSVCLYPTQPARRAKPSRRANSLPVGDPPDNACCIKSGTVENLRPIDGESTIFTEPGKGAVLGGDGAHHRQALGAFLKVGAG
jgi:hypothetical protein